MVQGYNDRNIMSQGAERDANMTDKNFGSASAMNPASGLGGATRAITRGTDNNIFCDSIVE